MEIPNIPDNLIKNVVVEIKYVENRYTIDVGVLPCLLVLVPIIYMFNRSMSDKRKQ
jgi:hypothetical protein